MRRHQRFARLAPSVSRERINACVRAESLVAARLEPAYGARFEAWLDLVFVRDGSIALAPFIQVEAPMLLVRESSPFLWPAWLPVDEPAAHEIEALVEPWLASEALVGSFDRERVRMFSDDAGVNELFNSARNARFLGAAPLESVLVDVAPYVYAQRFAAGARVGIHAPEAAFGTAILASSARTVTSDLCSPERDALAARWFGLECYGELGTAPFDVRIEAGMSVEGTASIALAGDEGLRTVVARPAFPSTVVSFDLDDATPVRAFCVRAKEPRLRPFRPSPMPVIGGSSGRIGVVVRDDGLRVPGADVDDALSLADALRTQGFDATVGTAGEVRAEQFDLLHLFGHRHVGQFGRILEDASARGVPIVLTPHLDDFEREVAWGSSALLMLAQSVFDDATRVSIERSLVERRIQLAGGAVRGTAEFDEPRVQAMIDRARAVIVACEAEERHLRARYGYAGPVRSVPAIVRPPALPEAIGARCGANEYVLVHAAVEPRANQWMAVRAAASERLPIVVLGTAENGDYYQNLLNFGGPAMIWLPQGELGPGALDAVYAAARVYADLSWSGRGAARIVRAAAFGCGLVISKAVPYAEMWPGLAQPADPSSVESVASALRLAWDRAPAIGVQIAAATAERADPLRSLQGILGAYAEAAAVRTV